MTCALRAQRAAERVPEEQTQRSVANLWCEGLLVAALWCCCHGEKQNPNVSCKKTRLEWTLGVLHAPIPNGFDHTIVFTPTLK